MTFWDGPKKTVPQNIKIENHYFFFVEIKNRYPKVN
jgi:hypothetical protein